VLLQDSKRFDVVITDLEMPGHGWVRVGPRAVRGRPAPRLRSRSSGLSSLVSHDAIERGPQSRPARLRGEVRFARA